MTRELCGSPGDGEDGLRRRQGSRRRQLHHRRLRQQHGLSCGEKSDVGSEGTAPGQEKLTDVQAARPRREPEPPPTQTQPAAAHSSPWWRRQHSTLLTTPSECVPFQVTNSVFPYTFPVIRAHAKCAKLYTDVRKCGPLKLIGAKRIFHIMKSKPFTVNTENHVSRECI